MWFFFLGQFCAKYSILLQAGNYVTKRQSLKLLGELLLNRANFNSMMKYINSADNLKIMMNLLRGNTKAIQFEAFHVFKIFVANPRKSTQVAEILVRNKLKLIDFLRVSIRQMLHDRAGLFSH
jgi:calcium binding protein 39